MTIVVNMRDRPDLLRRLERGGEHAGVVRIDRRSRWGNVYVIGRDSTRAQVIARYHADLRRRIRSGEIVLEDLADLHAANHYLCWCRPLPCHGDVLARAAEWAAVRLGRTQ